MDVEGINRSLFLALNAPAGLTGLSLYLSISAAKYSIVLLAAIVLWRWLRGNSRDRSVVVHIVLAVVPALAINYLFGLAFFHPRPFMIGLGQTYLAHAPEASFPSDHATFMWTIAFGMLYWSPARPSSWIAMLLAALTSWARVFLGVHFPFDIAGSMAVALVNVATFAPFLSLTARRIAEPIEAVYFFIARRMGWL